MINEKNANAVIFNNVEKSYGNDVILNKSSFCIPVNKLTCVLGVSGAGKTTLLNIISGLTDYTGEIINLPDNVSYVFQEDRLIPRMTVKENLVFFTGVKDEIKIENCLGKVGVLHKINKYAASLSGGEKQRVSIARALLKNSPLILLDEPFSALDVSIRGNMVKLLKNIIASENKTAVMVTHDITEAVFNADEILLFNNKTIIQISNDDADKYSTIKKIYELMGVN